MTLKKNHFVILLITFLVALADNRLVQGGLGWYRTNILPAWTPPPWVNIVAWTVVFTVSALAVILVWNAPPEKLPVRRRNLIITLFVTNAVLNVSWTVSFFMAHALGLSVVLAALLAGVNTALVFLLARFSRLAGALMLPPSLWLAFSLALTFAVWRLN